MARPAYRTVCISAVPLPLGACCKSGSGDASLHANVHSRSPPLVRLPNITVRPAADNVHAGSTLVQKHSFAIASTFKLTCPVPQAALLATMNTSHLSRSSSSIFQASFNSITPKKSPTIQNVQRRRLDIRKSEQAAYWALLNTSISTFLYYDLCYFKIIQFPTEIKLLAGALFYLEWAACILFMTSALYDFVLHFWPHTFMKPIMVSPAHKRLLLIQDDELGFEIERATPLRLEPAQDPAPPFEIQYSFQEDDSSRNGQKS